ncbi:class I adenylate-forming enzyme family protein [Micromonospora sp. AP08]|uniref:class I adenylate-forming enzyme family protein n=1 Tax=Micromonospora sp. AP08 TaxID=2604467 RepID=UPI001CA36999|nr:AMP-binding protein [Micromonospora sp. AP08]
MPEPDADLDLPPSPEHYVTRILDVVRRRADAPVLRWRDQDVSGTSLAASVHATAAALRDLGLRPDDTVGILIGGNRPATLTTRYAAHLLGASVVHVSGVTPGTSGPGLSLDAQARMLREANASVLVTDEEHAERAAGLRDVLPGLRLLTAPEGSEPAAGSPAAAAAPRRPRTANVTYTSGSTGRPKGVCMPFEGWNATVLWAASAVPSGAAITFLAVSPLSHSVGLVVDIMIAAGGTVLLRDGFDAGTVLRDIARHRVTGTMIGVPNLYALLDHPDLPHTDLASLRQLLYVGCPASPARLARALPFLGHALTQNYGTTEAGRITVLSPADHRRPDLLDTVGRPSPDVAVRICDPDSGRVLGPDELGEVCVRSTNMMTGYLDDPDLTARVLRDGWLRTGDLGRLDAEGYLRLSGRIGDVIKAGDVKVYPAEVEHVLAGHPDVVDACVYAYRDDNGLEQVHAAVVPRPGGAYDADALRRHVAAAMTAKHAPVVFVRCDRLPVAASGKVDRRQVRRLGLLHPRSGSEHPS